MRKIILCILNVYAVILLAFNRLFKINYRNIAKLARGSVYRIQMCKCGEILVVGKNVCFLNPSYFLFGNKVNISSNCVIAVQKAQNNTPCLHIGDNARIGEYNHFSCMNKISIGRNFLSGKFVTITDNSHGFITMENLLLAPWDRQLYSKGPIIIGDNVWIGDKATILPNVKIGQGSIIGANSVVTKDIPDYCVAAGNPAQVLKRMK